MIIEAFERKRRQIVRKHRLEEAAKIGAGLTLGAAIGATLGILFAPQAGSETREEIANKSRQAKEQVIKTANEVAEKAQSRAEELRQDIACNVEDVKGRALRVSQALKEGSKEIKKDLEAAKDDIASTTTEVADEATTTN